MAPLGTTGRRRRPATSGREPPTTAGGLPLCRSPSWRATTRSPIGGGVCKWSPLPWDLMNRTYRASLAQQGPFLQLSFSGVGRVTASA